MVGVPRVNIRAAGRWPGVARVAAAHFVLLAGFAGTPLPSVGSNLWGGLLLTILLALVGIVLSFPLGVRAGARPAQHDARGAHPVAPATSS